MIKVAAPQVLNKNVYPPSDTVVSQYALQGFDSLASNRFSIHGTVISTISSNESRYHCNTAILPSAISPHKAAAVSQHSVSNVDP